uniref:Uncharacterized protein n=1 Tax=Oryza glumipatula TaxID=40148 RepID=A0A0D9YTX0_9ORYZ
MMLLGSPSSGGYGGKFAGALPAGGTTTMAPSAKQPSSRAPPPGITGGRNDLRILSPAAAAAAVGGLEMKKPEAEGIAESLQATHRKELEASIRKQLQGVELSPSPYDTAWVAMVPLRGSSHNPSFPQCVDWILENQRDDGSWSIDGSISTANKDVLSSTLACVLALNKWNVGREHIRRGLSFIGRNFSIAMADQAVAPIGFGITFPAMLTLANGSGLEVPVRQNDIDSLNHLREMKIQREAGNHSRGRKAYMAYLAEGFGNLLEWDEIMMFQRKNGSLFNCPSSTAGALANYHDDKALQYLQSLVNKFDGVVPTLYPLNIYCQLSMVDALENMGISQYFASEIKSILDMTYSSWLGRDEEIMLDVTTCAMAFRLLRMNGYDVSSDELSHVAEASGFRDSLQGYLNDRKSVLEVYKTSKHSISENDLILDSIGSWSGSLLKEMLCSNGIQGTPGREEIEFALKYPFYSTLERLVHRKNIVLFDAKGSQMLKTECMPVHDSQDFLALAVDDFCISQSNYQNELNYLESWVKDNRLDQLHFARQKITYCYLSGAATTFRPEMGYARTSWARTAWLTAVIDDLFDVGGLEQEQENLLALMEKWEEPGEDEYYSEDVKIVFQALYNTVNEIGAKASALQGHDVTKYLVDVWLHLVRCMKVEAEWQRSQHLPTFEEYMESGMVSLGQGCTVMSALFLIGEKLPEGIVELEEYDELFRLMGTCGRLLNDIRGIEREESDGKMTNGVSLLVHASGGSMSVDEAKTEVMKRIDASRRKLLSLVVGEQEGPIPRPCKQLFWKMCKIFHLFYYQTDGFSSPKEMVSAVDAVIKEPLQLRLL